MPNPYLPEAIPYDAKFMFLARFISAPEPRVWQTSESAEGNARSGSRDTINCIGNSVSMQALQHRLPPLIPTMMLVSGSPLGHVSFGV